MHREPVLVSCLQNIADTIQGGVNAIDRNSAQWQIEVQRLESELIAEGQSTISNEVQSVAERGIATAGVELRCTADFVGQRVSQALERIVDRLRNTPVPPLIPAYCQVDPTEVQVDLIRSRRVTSLNFYGYDMFDKSPSDSPMKVFLRDANGNEQDISFALGLPHIT